MCARASRGACRRALHVQVPSAFTSRLPPSYIILPASFNSKYQILHSPKFLFLSIFQFLSQSTVPDLIPIENTQLVKLRNRVAMNGRKEHQDANVWAKKRY